MKLNVVSDLGNSKLHARLLTTYSYGTLWNLDEAARATCNELVRVEQLSLRTSCLP
jgi:hypothetical protein